MAIFSTTTLPIATLFHSTTSTFSSLLSTSPSSSLSTPTSSLSIDIEANHQQSISQSDNPDHNTKNNNHNNIISHNDNDHDDGISSNHHHEDRQHHQTKNMLLMMIMKLKKNILYTNSSLSFWNFLRSIFKSSIYEVLCVMCDSLQI